MVKIICLVLASAPNKQSIKNWFQSKYDLQGTLNMLTRIYKVKSELIIEAWNNFERDSDHDWVITSHDQWAASLAGADHGNWITELFTHWTMTHANTFTDTNFFSSNNKNRWKCLLSTVADSWVKKLSTEFSRLILIIHAN